MKGNEKNILIGSVVVALLIIAASWKFLYSADIEKAEQVQNDINALQVRLDELNSKNANRAMYEAGIANSQDIIDTILAIYGPGNTPEKTIMLVVDLCKKTGCEISSISFQDDRLLFASETSEDGVNPDIEIYSGGMAISISSGYTQMKKIMDYINSYAERMNADNFSASFSANDGRITMSMKVNFYAVHDKNHVYEAPVIEDIDLGTVNIFRSEYIPEEEELEEGVEVGNTTTQLTSNTSETSETSDTE